MDLDLLRPSTRLPRDATVRLRGRRGARLECLSGTLWVTQDGDPRDVVLSAGDAFDFDRDGLVLASALGAEGGARYLLLDRRDATAAAA